MEGWDGNGKCCETTVDGTGLEIGDTPGNAYRYSDGERNKESKYLFIIIFDRTMRGAEDVPNSLCLYQNMSQNREIAQLQDAKPKIFNLT